MLRMEIFFLTNIIWMTSCKHKWIIAHYFEEHTKNISMMIFLSFGFFNHFIKLFISKKTSKNYCRITTIFYLFFYHFILKT